MTQDILNSLKGIEAELIRIRRDIHKHPETAFEEVRTADLVAAKLTEWGIPVHRGLAKTGVVGTLHGSGNEGGRSIGLRADMDALNLLERNTFDYASVHKGKMHACGHDGHTAMLLGAARYLSEHRNFNGTLHFIFQPAEEGEGGARVMIEEGLFDQFPCDAVYGMHNMPGLPLGQFAIRPGSMMAASDTWTVVFRGTGGHGAMPHMGTDPTQPTAAFVTATQNIIGRNVSPQHAAVLSVGHIAAGSYGSPNVIPAEVTVRGTARSYTPADRDLLERRLGEAARGIAAAHGCTVEYHYLRRYPPLVNASAQTEIALRAAAATVGVDKVDGDVERLTGAEDFAFMLEKKPGAYILLGNGGSVEDGSCHYVHTPHYDFNDQALVTGVAYWVNLVAEELGTR
ncbi:M20 aminoacylase family protein [Ferrovibrio sp.]|uniref:M20 aminoacylase family protein n=1 Tax=Ferrovibrio sp. TaxID=1917215 RepID=UPI003D27F84A